MFQIFVKDLLDIINICFIITLYTFQFPVHWDGDDYKTLSIVLANDTSTDESRKAWLRLSFVV